MSPFVPGMSRVWIPPIITITSLTPLPSREKMARPLARHGLRWSKKKRVAHSSNLHKCSSHCKFVSGDLGTWLRVSVNCQPIPFPAPLVGPCHKVSSGRLCSSCRDVSQQENLSQGILWPVLFRGTPISTPWAPLPIISAGNSCLDLNMAVLSP